MKKLIWGIVAVIALLVGGLVAIPYFVDVNQYKPFIVESAKKITGRELTIEGDIALSVFPDIGLEVSKVSLSNLPGSKEPVMASVSTLQLQVALLPLLQGGEIHVKKFVLVDPEIFLLVTKQGVKNWEFTLPSGQGNHTGQTTQKQQNKGKIPSVLASVSGVTVKNGTFRYVNEQTHAAETLTKVNATFALEDFSDPLILAGSAVWNGQETSGEIKVDTLDGLYGEKGSEVAFQLSNPLFFTSYKGTLALGDKGNAAGKFTARSSDMGGLVAWLDKKPAPEGKKQPLEVKSEVKRKGKAWHFTALELASHDFSATGDITADMTAKVPFITGVIAAGDVDLGLYTDKKEVAEAAASGKTTQEGWSNEPIDLVGLRAVNADIAFTAKSFTSAKLNLGVMDTKIRIKDGRLTVDVNRIDLYDGMLKGTVTTDGSGNVPAITTSLALSDVNAEKFLKGVFGIKKISGKLNGSADLAMAGKTQKAMVSNLNGKGRFDLADGKIRSVNLISMLQNAASAFQSAGGGSEETEFDSMGGSVTITNGIVRNNDLVMKTSTLNIEGAGTADLPRKYLDYRLVPHVGGKLGKGAEGLTVPVIVRGPFSHLTYIPDAGSVIKDVLQDPAKAKEQLKTLEDNFRALRDGFKF